MLIPERELAALAELSSRGVEYLLIGGCAVQYHGVDRQTSDVDIWAANDPQNARRLLDAIEGIIGHRPDISVEQLSQPRKHVRFQNDGLKIDLLTSVRDHDFQEAFKGRETMLVGSKEIPVVSKAVLLQIKQTVAETDPSRREQELRAIILLEAVSPSQSFPSMYPSL